MHYVLGCLAGDGGSLGVSGGVLCISPRFTLRPILHNKKAMDRFSFFLEVGVNFGNKNN